MGIDTRSIEGELDELVDGEYRQGLATAVPTSWKIRGVRVPALKRIAKERKPKKKTEEDYLDILGFLDEAFQGKDRELSIVGINLLVPYRKFYDSKIAVKTRQWIALVDDWEICDNLSYLVMSELIMKGLLEEKDLLFLRDHPNLFARRAYIVCRVKLLRKGWGDTRKQLEDLSCFVDDRDAYIVKALSWALREASKSDPVRVRAFLDRYGERLAPKVVREVTRKLEKGTKR